MTCWRGMGVLSIALLASGWLAPADVSAAAPPDALRDLRLTSAGDLLNICTHQPEQEDYTAAMSFCYGFFEGGIRYAEAISGANNPRNLVCAPAGTTRLQAVEVYIDYMRANSQYLGEQPIDAVYRALIGKWPCPQ
jgi:hypothetical protein